MPMFWWRDRKLAVLCAAANHLDPLRIRAELEWAQAIASGNQGGPPWLSVPRSGLLSVGKKEKKQGKETYPQASINTTAGGFVN